MSGGETTITDWPHSPLHRLDPRSKILAVVAVVSYLVVSSGDMGLKAAAISALLMGLIRLSRVPLGYCLRRACLVLPFSLMAVAVALLGRWLPGSQAAGGLSTGSAAALVVKSYLSALAVLLLVATTRLADLLAALERLRVPASFLMIVHFLYRYLFVLSEEAQHMSCARRSRGGGGRRAASWRAAAAALAVLFVRAYARAERVHRAMLARGFTGVLPVGRRLRWQARDSAFAAFSLGYLAAVETAAAYLL